MSVRTSFRHTTAACYLGYITQAAVVNLAPILFLIFGKTYQIPLAGITLLATVNFLVQLVTDLVAPPILDRIGYRKGIVTAHLLAAAGLVGLSVFPVFFPTAYSGLMTAVVLYAIGGGLLEVLVSPIVEACPNDNKASAMSLLHSFYCWGMVLVILLSTGFLWVFGQENFRVLPVLWAVLPLANSLYFSLVPINTLTEEGKAMTVSSVMKDKWFWVFALLMVAAGASEQGMAQWASAFAEKGLGISKALGDLLGPCLFAVVMGICRMLHGKWGEKMPLAKLLLASGGLCIVSYLICGLSQNPVFSLVGCVLCGVSVSVLWPGVISMASQKRPTGGTALFALLALAGDLGCSVGPTTVGLTSSYFDGRLQAGMLGVILFPLLLILGTLLLKKDQKA
jgi:MFS family permease